MKNYSLNKLKSVIYILTSLLLILILAYTSESNIFITNTLCLWILGFVYFFLYLRLVFDKSAEKFLKLKKKGNVILIVLLSSILLCGFLPIRFQKIIDENMIERGMRSTKITIEALGEKNAESQGYEVCLEGIRINGVEDYNLYNIKLNQDWDFVDGRPTYLKQIKSNIKIDLGYIKTYEIIMRKNESAGKVNIKIGPNEYEYDLYSKEEDSRNSIDLSKVFLQNQEKSSDLQKGLFYFTYFIIVGSIMYSVVVFVKVRIKKVIL